MRQIKLCSIAALASAVALSWAGAAFAQDQPLLPYPSLAQGDFYTAVGTIQRPNYQQGQYLNGMYYFYGGGDYRPVDSPDHLTLTVNGTYTSISISPQGNPLDSVFVRSSSTPPQDPVFTDFGLAARADLLLTSLVRITAHSQQAADALTQLLGTDGGIASIVGQYHVDGTGSAAEARVGASTGLNTLDPSLQHNFYVSCSTDSYFGTPEACMPVGSGNAAYMLPLNFVAGTTYADGDPLSFYSSFSLSADAETGPHGTGYTTGIANAFIDPAIAFAAGLNISDYTLSVGGTAVPFATASVPEPATWAMLLFGFGAAGIAMRRRPAGGAVRSLFACGCLDLGRNRFDAEFVQSAGP